MLLQKKLVIKRKKFSIQHLAARATTTTFSPSSQIDYVHVVHENKKYNKYPGRKKRNNNKDKKGDPNNGKPKQNNNDGRGKKECIKLEFPCNICKGCHHTYQFQLMEGVQMLLSHNQHQPVVLNNPFQKANIWLQVLLNLLEIHKVANKIIYPMINHIEIWLYQTFYYLLDPNTMEILNLHRQIKKILIRRTLFTYRSL